MRTSLTSSPWRRRRPAALTVLGMVLAMLVVPARAGAQGTASSSGSCDRSQVVLAWQTGGSQVQAAAQTALLGSDADVCAFLGGIRAQRSAVDKRLSVDQMLAAGGPAVQAAAQAALDGGGDALDAFLTSGWQPSWVTDQRVRVDQMMAAGGSQLRAAGQKALDAGTADALTTFLNSGWQAPYATDQRLRVNQILASGGPEVRTEAQRALDAGDVDSLTRFIDVEWPVAAARDEETSQISDLVQAAVDAGNTAASETAEAKDESQKAVAAAAAAKAAAANAAAAASRANGDAQAAAAAAKQAADAARNAAAAAQQAISAAAAANASARVAANAAARAATAAAQTSRAASQAQQSAAAAATDASKAADARAAATAARDMAAKAKSAADAAQKAGDAAKQAAAAGTAARAASDDSNAAAQAALAAANDAHNAGADASQAQAAANEAASEADRADRAAASAVSYANEAANAAYASRDAANRAVADANAAADAADEAAEHAGEAAEAAQKATEYANAALAAAQAAVTAAQQAQSIYDADRAAEAQQLQISFEQNDQAAQTALAAQQTQQATAAWDAQQAAKRSAQTNQLIALVNDPDTAHDQAVADARQVAFTLTASDGSWTRAAAIQALGGDDTVVLDFVHNGIAAAAGQDDRATLSGLLAATSSDAMRTAGEAALAGSDADVAAFLASQDYPGRQIEDREAVDQVMASAQSAGDTVVLQRGQAALDDGSDQALRAFLDTGQYGALAVDERVKVNQILADPASGPETKDAAQVALDGPTQFLTQFLQVGQYQAAQDDQDTAAHDGAVSAMLLQATEAATTATQDALEAQAAAATARGAASEALTYAQQAAASAQQAMGYAQQAQQSADAAQTSADHAAASATTAKNAAAAADTAARNAARSAEWAQASAQHAQNYASNAYAAYTNAYNSAIAAGKDEAAAVAAANEAFADAKQQYQDEQSRWAYEQSAQCEAPLVDYDSCMSNLIKEMQNPLLTLYINGGACAVLYHPGVYYDNCVNDALSPTFNLDQASTIAAGVLTSDLALLTFELQGIGLVATLLDGVGAVMDAFGVFSESTLFGMDAVELESITEGSEASVGLSDLNGILEEDTIQAEADESALEQATADMLDLSAQGFGVATDPDTAFFWSGTTDGVGGATTAAAIARANGGTTLESLMSDRGIPDPGWDPGDPANQAFWGNISEEYANGASGTVRAVVGENLRPGNVWETRELRALKNNVKVTKIIKIDPKTGAQTVIFER